MTFKNKCKTENGVTRVWEEEAELALCDGQKILHDPNYMFALARTTPVLQTVMNVFSPAEDFVSLGSFSNNRYMYVFDDAHRIELDETQYAFGTTHTLEMETSSVCADAVKGQLLSWILFCVRFFIGLTTSLFVGKQGRVFDFSWHWI